ncbi:MAG: hypothetical protein R6T85_11225, partial [Egibacteraceae bacterium]
MHSTTRPRRHPSPHGCQRHLRAAAAGLGVGVGVLAAEEPAGYTAAAGLGVGVGVLAAEEPAGYTAAEEPAGSTADGAGAAAEAGVGGALSLAGLLDTIGEALGQLAGLPLGGAVGDTELLDAHTALTGLLARVHRERLRALGEIDERGAYRLAGVRSAASLLERCHQHTPYEALGYVRTANELADLPDTDAALARGELNYEQ